MKPAQGRWNLNIHYHRVVLDAIPDGATSALDIGSGNGLLSFDLLAATAVLHHVDREGLRRMTELVRPGGTVAIVGFANPSGPVDWALIIAGFLLTRARAAMGRYWEHHAPMRWPPPLTIDDMRRLAESEMPGATFKRAMAHRYTIVWSRPVAPTSR